MTDLQRARADYRAAVERERRAETSIQRLHNKIHESRNDQRRLRSRIVALGGRDPEAPKSRP